MTRREWVSRATAAGLAAAVGCREHSVSRIGQPDADELKRSAVDYATARKGFRTKLTRTGPAPEPAPMPANVPGALAVPYSSQGRQLMAWANPEAKVAGTRRPAVLFLHGGFSFGADQWEYARPFLKKGFHVLIPVLRAENEQPGSFSLFYDEVDDCLAAADALSRLNGVDPNKMFVCGHSVGGTMALLTALASDRFRGCAAYSPFPDAKVYLKGREQVAPFDLSAVEEYRMRSPIVFAAYFHCPIRSFYGQDEGQEAFDLAREMGRIARTAQTNIGELRVSGDHATAVAPASRDTIYFFEECGVRG